jgi:hypothetical protein
MKDKVLADYRAALAALTQEKERLFPGGTKVHVDCGRYKGPGIVAASVTCPPHQVAVRLGNGNIWWYPIESVFPV